MPMLPTGLQRHRPLQHRQGVLVDVLVPVVLVALQLQRGQLGQQDEARAVWQNALKRSPGNATLQATVRKFQP